MKYTKVNYFIAGYGFENGREYGIATKKSVDGYTADTLGNIAIRKVNAGNWQLDHMPTGLKISAGYKTRDAAAADCVDHWKKIINDMYGTYEKEKNMKQQEEKLHNMPTEEEVSQYETVNYCTVYNRRFDKVNQAAKRSGCIIKNADKNTYLDGGNINIYGTPGMLAEVKTLIENYNAIDAEKAAAAKRETEENKMQENKTNVQEVKTTEPENVQEVKTEEKAEKIDLATLTAENINDYLPALLMSLANDKHNTSIILAAGIEAGVISPSELLVYFHTGKMPAVHTFDVWKKAGYTVRKGEHAAFTARIWKYTEKAAGTVTEEEAAAINGMIVNADGSNMVEPGDEKKSRNFIKKLSYFFTAAQVDKTPEPATLPELPADVKQEVKKGCTWISGNTRPIKEDLKKAGFRWSKKNSAWYRAA